jgi:hypothetical protein
MMPMTDKRESPRETALTPADATALMHDEDEQALRTRWTEIQTGFVDEPVRAVKEADALVAATLQKITEGLAGERSKLEAQWAQQKEASTEDLRVVLQRYRAFFGRVLGMRTP